MSPDNARPPGMLGLRFYGSVTWMLWLPAVLMVVTYHVWLGRVSGGVDIFLLTLSFVRKVEAGKALNLVAHWLHHFKRLLPAAVVVLLGTWPAPG